MNCVILAKRKKCLIVRLELKSESIWAVATIEVQCGYKYNLDTINSYIKFPDQDNNRQYHILLYRGGGPSL